MSEALPDSGPPHRKIAPHADAADLGGADDELDAGSEPPHWAALARQLAGESSAGDDAAVQAWVDSHPTDAAAVTALDRTLDRLAFAPPADLDVEGALQRVRARRALEAGPTPPVYMPVGVRVDVPDVPIDVPDPKVVPFRRRAATPAPRRWAGQLRAAAVIGGLAIGAAGWWLATRSGSATAHTYATAVGQRDSVRLADGSRVILAPGSTLDVPADYGTSIREVQLRGEALFEVRHDEAHPFRVRTQSASVNDIGTVFVVRESTDGAVMVSVSEGAVRLHAAAGASKADSGVILHAGDRGMVAVGAMASSMPGSATGDDAAWTGGSLVFRDATVAEVAAELRRWYGVELKVADSALAGRTLTTSFHGDSVEQVLRVIGLTLGATMERHGDTVTVTTARR